MLLKRIGQNWVNEGFLIYRDRLETDLKKIHNFLNKEKISIIHPLMSHIYLNESRTKTIKCQKIFR